VTILHKLNCMPKYIMDGLCYLTTGGSRAYGTSNDLSDVDLVGIYVSPRQNQYPQEYGYIQGFSSPPEAVEVKQIHHVFDGDTEYDINCFNLIHWFKLASAGNPNIIDAINTEPKYHHMMTEVGKYIYDNRDAFVSKAMYPRFRGMIKNHLDKLLIPRTVGKRVGLVERFGYDTKDAGHCIRVQLNMLSLLTHGEYNLQTHAPLIKEIREGVFGYDELMGIYHFNENQLNTWIKTSNIRDKVDSDRIHKMLQTCLDIHYGAKT